MIPEAIFMKRLFDLIISLIAIPIVLIPALIICLSMKMSSKDSILFWSKRVGVNNKIFLMPKFRTMISNTPDVATHLLKDPDQYLTSMGPFLRRTSLDEIPQLYSVFLGDMSLVGPRPALFNQNDLIELRKKEGIDQLMPGLTGWAQINGRDDLSINDKVKYDLDYMKRQSLLFDLKIILLTIKKIIWRSNVSH